MAWTRLRRTEKACRGVIEDDILFICKSEERDDGRRIQDMVETVR